jgi:TrkA domain protein
MADVQETHLPGIGVRFDFPTSTGTRVGVLVHKTGRRELLVYQQEDPDECAISVDLARDEARTLAEMLGASRIIEQLDNLRQEVDGLSIDWITIDENAEWANRTLSEAAIHTQTGVSIVAMITANGPIVAPGAGDVLRPGTTIVAVGLAEGIRKLTTRLRLS